MLYNNNETTKIVCEEFLVSSFLLDDGIEGENTTVVVHWGCMIIFRSFPPIFCVKSVNFFTVKDSMQSMF